MESNLANNGPLTANQVDTTPPQAHRTAYSPAQAQEYDQRRFTSESGRRIHAFELRQVQQALSRVDNRESVLEVGCGTGRLLVEVKQTGRSIDGVDASGAMIEQVRQKLDPDLAGTDLILAEAAAIPKPSNRYGLVYAVRLLNQTESPDYALRVVSEMIRLAKPDRYVLVEFVNQHRPRWGAAAKPTTRLRPRQVIEHADQMGADLVRCSGCFFLSMQAYHAAPTFLVKAVVGADRLLSWVFPRLCARCYVLLRKRETIQAREAA